MRGKIALALALGVLTTTCMSGGFNSAQKVQQLSPGMTFEETVELLGAPKDTVVMKGQRVATFWLHQSWRGNVPFDLVFAGKPEVLQSWGENEEKFAESQARLQAITNAFGEATGGGAAAPAGPNDPQLQQQIAGLWYSYEGTTERAVGLCADGTYLSNSESSYSGRSSDMLGNETLAWGAASQDSGQGRWTISGTAQSGSIHMRAGDGSTSNVTYQQIGDPGCLSFNGTTFCRKQASCR